MVIKCPICKKKFINRAVKLHIINAAESEAYKHMNMMLDYAKNKPTSYSPAVLLRNVPHLAFIRRNLKKI